MADYSRHSHDRRSRSPRRDFPSTRRKRSRSRSRQRPYVHQIAPRDGLPFGATPLRTQDYGIHKGLFGSYLDIQKQLFLDDLDERESRGRWKSFVRKWNEGTLAEGWYDPATAAKAEASFAADFGEPDPRQEQNTTYHEDDDKDRRRNKTRRFENDYDDDDDDDDEYGPSLPSAANGRRFQQRLGASAPSIQTLELRREQAEESLEASRADLRYERRKYRKEEQSRQDELTPRAEPGTRERQMEKKREAAASNKVFAEFKTEAGGTQEVRDDDLMGGEDGADEYKRRKREMEMKKSERDLRREEILRARQEERLERVRAYREKEEKTMAGLIALAKQKYG